jgi:hypothetical protein
LTSLVDGQQQALESRPIAKISPLERVLTMTRHGVVPCLLSVTVLIFIPPLVTGYIDGSLFGWLFGWLIDVALWAGDWAESLSRP